MPWQAIPGFVIIFGAYSVIGIGIPAVEALILGTGRSKRIFHQGEDKFVRRMDFRGNRINYFREQEEIKNGVFENNFPGKTYEK